MGCRKAAMMRRPQYVSGHFRRSSKGKRYWVKGHSRNSWKPGRPPSQAFAVVCLVGLITFFIVMATAW